jgi:hypothetical protein
VASTGSGGAVHDDGYRSLLCARGAVLLVASPGKGIADDGSSWEAGCTYDIILFGPLESDRVSSSSGSPTFSLLLLLPGGGEETW